MPNLNTLHFPKKVFLGISIIALFLGACDNSAPKQGTNEKPASNKSQIVQEMKPVNTQNTVYKIISINDLSMKTIQGNLSDYSNKDIKSLPLNIRKEYRIVIPSKISEADLKKAMRDLVKNETQKNPDIDEIVIFAYDRAEDTNGAYTFGKMEWCPNGEWGSVTPRIAISNNRASYQYKYDISKKVEKLDESNLPTKREFEIYDIYDKELWADPDANEDMVKNKVAKKLGISGKELDKIYLKVTEYKMK